MVPSFLAVDHMSYVRHKLLIGLAAQHFSSQVVVGLREEAGADFAVGGEADAAAVAAEGPGDGGDNADFAAPIGEGVAARGLAGRVRGATR